MWQITEYDFCKITRMQSQRKMAVVYRAEVYWPLLWLKPLVDNPEISEQLKPNFNWFNLVTVNGYGTLLLLL